MQFSWFYFHHMLFNLFPQRAHDSWFWRITELWVIEGQTQEIPLAPSSSVWLFWLHIFISFMKRNILNRVCFFAAVISTFLLGLLVSPMWTRLWNWDQSVQSVQFGPHSCQNRLARSSVSCRRRKVAKLISLSWLFGKTLLYRELQVSEKI